MKKLFMLMSGLLLFAGCSNDNDDEAPPVPATPSQSFMLDNRTYPLIGFQAITELRMPAAYTFDGQTYDRSTITLIGMMGFTETATVAFDLYYKTGMPVAGSYTIDDNEDDMSVFENALATQNRACMGWTSMGTIFQINGGDSVDANNPSGTVTIVANSAANYTITYTGNFKLYDGFDFIRNVPCSVNVTGEVNIQQQP